MKKINVFLSLMVCLGAFLTVGCSEQDDAVETTYRSVEVSLQATNANLVSTKAAALGDESEMPYCIEDGEFTENNYVVAAYDVVFFDAAGLEVAGESLIGEELTWTVTASETVTNTFLDTLSALFQIDYPTDATTATLTINDFSVYADDTKATLLFVTPELGSAYAGYVSTPVAHDFTIGLYEKVYLGMEVLCFNEEEIAKFGFGWSDFDVVTGDEICCFFNCNGTTAATYHQVLSADLSAKFSGSDVAYWEGQNYGGEYTNTANCIPCPGDWKDNGMTIVVAPTNSPSEAFEIDLSADQINAFLDSEELSFYDFPGTSIDSLVIETANDVAYMHFYSNDCFEDGSDN